MNFESGHVRPLARVARRQLKLFAVNTPDNRLEIYTVGRRVADARSRGAGRARAGRRRDAHERAGRTEAWVVNHLSDSVSIVERRPADVDASRTSRARSLVGDEPRDIVFAGPRQRRAFVTTARRGQNCPVVRQPHDARASAAPSSRCSNAERAHERALGGGPIANIVLFTDTPRALAKSPSGDTVVRRRLPHAATRRRRILEPTVTGSGNTPAAAPARLDAERAAAPA